jgi:MbtH protein
MTKQKSDEARGQNTNPAPNRVVINDEGQYSIWPCSGKPPLGWYETGFQGSSGECSAHIDTVWTDMRPKSLRARDGAAMAPTQH